jgi:hypothetical protein
VSLPAFSLFSFSPLPRCDRLNESSRELGCRSNRITSANFASLAVRSSPLCRCSVVAVYCSPICPFRRISVSNMPQQHQLWAEMAAAARGRSFEKKKIGRDGAAYRWQQKIIQNAGTGTFAQRRLNKQVRKQITQGWCNTTDRSAQANLPVCGRVPKRSPRKAFTSLLLTQKAKTRIPGTGERILDCTLWGLAGRLDRPAAIAVCVRWRALPAVRQTRHGTELLHDSDG